MMKQFTIAAALAFSFAFIATAQDDPIEDAGSVADASSEPPALRTATINDLTGPVEAVGVTIELQGELDLGEIFPLAEADGRLYRGRKVFVAPGGVVPIHSHEGRPAITYVAEGEIVEYRSDADGPIDHKKGDATFDKGGVAQWWENKSDALAVLLVVDILPSDGEGRDEM